MSTRKQSRFRTILGNLGRRLLSVSNPSLSSASSFELQFPVLIPLRAYYKKLTQESNARKIYRLLKEVDPELMGSVDRISKMSREAYQGFTLNVGREMKDEEQELINALEEFEREFKLKAHFYAITDQMVTYGDAVYFKRIEENVGLAEFKSLPMEYLTAIENEEQKRDHLAQVFEANFYVLSESTERERTFNADDVVHFALNNIGSTIYDLMGRYTYGIWSSPPLEPLRPKLLWKLALLINDIMLRQHLVPRQHHKLNLEGFNPANFPGDTLEDRYAAAEAAATKHINDYRTKVATPLKEADKSVITGNDIEISIIEPRNVTYVDPNELLTQIDQSIYAAIAPIETAVTGRGVRSYASELLVSAYGHLVAETLADIIAAQFLELAKAHIQAKYNHRFDGYLDDLSIELQLVIGIEKSERVRQGAVMRASQSLTPNEYREMIGKPPLTDDQWEEMERAAALGRGPGRTGDFDQTTDDVTSSFIQRIDVDDSPDTPQSRRQRQNT